MLCAGGSTANDDAELRAPARLLAVARPRSFCPWVEKMTESAPSTFCRKRVNRAPYSCGSAQPVVSGMLTVVAPACRDASCQIEYTGMMGANAGFGPCQPLPSLRGSPVALVGEEEACCGHSLPACRSVWKSGPEYHVDAQLLLCC